MSQSLPPRRRGPVLIEGAAPAAAAAAPPGPVPRDPAAAAPAGAGPAHLDPADLDPADLDPADLDPAHLDPATAPPVPDTDDPQAPGTALATGTDTGLVRATRSIGLAAARRPSRLAALAWSAAAGLVLMMATTAAWDFAAGLVTRSPVLGWTAAALAATVALGLAAWLAGELAALSRLSRIDGLQARARAAATAGRPAVLALIGDLGRFYAGRADLAWGRDRLAARRDEVLDADALLHLAERSLMQPLDDAARSAIESAARQVATVTAVVPLALADVAAALIANTRMVRRIAEIYGGRAGMFGSWRLFRAVAAHLVATGAVAVGDDLISSVAGGGVVSKLSRRFGEGVVNAALTARVGIAAIEVCRPLPFAALPRPKVTSLVRRALAGLFGGSA
jgi:putative membrane protein